MTVTPTILTRAAGLGAAAAGALFLAVQIKHPHLDAAFVTTTEWKVREGMKVLMAVLALAGITAMYSHHVRQTGALGLVGYVLFSIGYLSMLGVELIGLCVLPVIAGSRPGYVDDVLAVATGGHAAGDVGLFPVLSSVMGLGYLGGGLLFGIALYRAGILARWASALLAAGSLATAAIPLLPMVNQRLFAIPTGIALIGLGYSLWQLRQAPAEETAAATQPTPAGVR